MRKFALFLAIVTTLASCHNKKSNDPLKLVKELSIKQYKNEFYGFCYMKTLKKDIFIWNLVSKKIWHFVIKNNNAEFKDSFNYSKLSQRAMADYYLENKANHTTPIQLVKQLNTIGDMNLNNGGMENAFNLNLDILLVQGSSSSSHQSKLVGYKYYQVHYDTLSSGFQVKKIALPDSVFKNGYNLIDYKQGTALCEITKAKGAANEIFTILPLNDVGDSILSYSSDHSKLTVSNIYDTVLPQVNMGGYIFNFRGPFYFNTISGKQFNLKGVLPDEVFNYYNTSIQTQNRIIFNLGKGETKDNIYDMTTTATDSMFYIFRINKATGTGNLICKITKNEIQKGPMPATCSFDDEGHLVVVDVLNGSIKYYEL